MENYLSTRQMEEEEKSLSASITTSGNFLTTSNASVTPNTPRQQLSFRKNLGEMKRLIQRSRPSEGSSPRNFSPTASPTTDFGLTSSSSSNPLHLVTSGGSLIGRTGTKSLTNSLPAVPQVNTSNQLSFNLPVIKITSSTPNNLQRDVSEDSTEVSENYYFFSRIHFPVSQKEKSLIRENFDDTLCNDRLLSEEAVKTMQLKFAQSVFVKKGLEESSRRVNVLEEYTPSGSFGAPTGRFLTASALLSFPVSEDNLLEVINYQVLPSYGMIYNRIPATMALARNVHMIEAVSPVLIHSNHNYPMSEQVVPQYLSVLTKAGFILTFKRIAPANMYPRPSPPWTLVEEPELLFSINNTSGSNTLKASSKSPSSPSEERRRRKSNPTPTVVAEPSIIIEIVQSELSLLVLPNYLHITSRFAQNIIARYLYPHHHTQFRNEPHVVHTLDAVLASTFEHTLHVNPRETHRNLWWTRSTGSPYLNDLEVSSGFCKLLPNGTPWFEITSIGRGDLFQYVFGPLNTQVTESGPFFNPLFASYKPPFYNPQRELQELKEEMLKNWRLCAERMQPPACQVARSLASLYIFRLVKLICVPMNEIHLYVCDQQMRRFEENRREVIRRLNQLALTNGLSSNWSTENDPPKLFYIYNKLASIPVIMEPLTNPPPQINCITSEDKLNASVENEPEAAARLASTFRDDSMVGSISYSALASYLDANPHILDDFQESDNY